MDSKKIIGGVVALVVVVVIAINTIPNYSDGGNKSIFRADDSYVEPSHHNASNAHSEAAHSATSTSEEETPQKEIATEELKKKSNLNHKLEFTAYKTPEKVGVKGTFNQISLYNTKDEANNLAEAMDNSTFEINANSINTSDATGLRDPKLRKFFFNQLASSKIIGIFKSFKGGVAKVSITMNNVTKEVDFKYTENGGKLSMTGSIDMIKDFSANKAFNAIHEACKDLHLNKTWTDVSLNIEVSK